MPRSAIVRAAVLRASLVPGIAAAIVLALLLPTAAARAADPVPGRVTHVTLYRGQALVTRSIPLAGEKGTVELVVSELPEQVAPDSLFAEGGEQVEVRAVRFRSRAVGEEPREEVRQLDEAIEEVNRQIELNSSNQQLVVKQNAYLDQLEAFVAPTATTDLAKGVLDAEALQALTKFAFENRQSLAAQQVDLAQEARELGKQLALLQRQRAELTAGATRTMREAVLFLEKHADGDQTVRLSYLVNNCGWAPTYVMRATAEGKQVSVEYNALIQQLTGEDWTDVALTLSTASPALSAAGPGLAPFRVTLSSGQDPGQHKDNEQIASELRSIRQEQQMAIVSNLNSITFSQSIDSSWAANTAATQLQCLELVSDKSALSTLRIESAPDEQGPSLSYRLGGTVSLASRSDQQMVRILQAELPSKFYYVATPVLTSYVYREAELTNSGAEDLLGGPITVYLDGRFVGQGEIPTVARGEVFVVGFGADPQLRARRELADKGDSVQGGNRELNFDYRLVIENFKNDAAAVRVFDRLPSSGNGADIRVTLGEMSDELSKDALYIRRERPKGLLRWDIEAAAATSGEKARLIEYSFRVDYDRNFQLTSADGSQQLQQEYEQLQRQRGKR